MSSNLHSAYKKILERNKGTLVLGSVIAIINWDMETMMPLKAVELRSEQLALLKQLHHKMRTAPAIGKLLDTILRHQEYDTLKDFEKRNVQLIKKDYDENIRLPTKLITAMAKQQTLTVNMWKKAKAQNNYAFFKPELERLVALNKQAAKILMKVKETKTPYDALIDIYEPRMNSQAITEVFNKLQLGLRHLLEKIMAQRQPETSVLQQPVAIEKQRKIAKLLLQTLGYETPPNPEAMGRLDETEHPFTAGYYDDVRITTHYYLQNPLSSIFSVLHETGHAIYEQHLPREWKYQPVGMTCSMGLHESQSRLFENLFGRSREFWTGILPKIKDLAKPSFSNLDLDKFVCAVNAVKPSKIRIEADEITYSLHIIIRFQIEEDIFAEKIRISELPEVWTQKYEENLGVNVKNDSEGVMQDTHWASGLYGYFPSYALGNIYSGQIIDALRKDYPSWPSDLTRCEFGKIQQWLVNNIYRHGNLYDPTDLIKKATGTKLTVNPYLSYLREKYSRLYGF